MGKISTAPLFTLPPLLMSRAAAAEAGATQSAATGFANQEAGASPNAVGQASALAANSLVPPVGARLARADDDAPILWRPHGDSGGATHDPSGAPGDAKLSQATAPMLLAQGYAPLHAAVLPPATHVLGKGTVIGCTLETAIESQLAGLVSCLIGVPVYGVDGKAVLMSRGTRLLGEARSDARSGQSRVFVLWVEARTPDGILVPLASPATDALGRAGVPGSVDTHFFERFGAAILISVLDGAAQGLANHSGGNTVVIAPQSSETILAEVLRATVAIPPTISVAPGAHLTVLVARDVEFGAPAAAGGSS
jgi:type IV secretion system protein VirB10